jgi:hypothetical protein
VKVIPSTFWRIETSVLPLLIIRPVPLVTFILRHEANIDHLHWR